MTARQITKRIRARLIDRNFGTFHATRWEVEQVVKATHVVECIEALEEFEKRYESDFFRLTSSGEDGRVLADWVSKVHRALALAKGETHER